MSTPTTTPPSPSSSPAATSPTATSRETLIHNVALGALIVCPIIILLPPRKLDIYTVALTAGFFAGGNQLAQEYTGSSIVSRFGSRMQGITSQTLPPKALETQRRLREERERMALGAGLSKGVEVGEEGGSVKVLAELKKVEEQRGEKEERERRERGLLKKVWMGDEGDDWKAKRDQREREALEDGRGYGGLIIDQIYEVWGWGKDKVEEVKEADEKVVREEKEGKK